MVSLQPIKNEAQRTKRNFFNGGFLIHKGNHPRVCPELAEWAAIKLESLIYI